MSGKNKMKNAQLGENRLGGYDAGSRSKIKEFPWKSFENSWISLEKLGKFLNFLGKPWKIPGFP